MAIPLFGSLKRLDPREVWLREAADFTPWLAQNISALGAALGLELTLEAREAPVGPFSLDLLARDLSSNRPVIIENQLSPTDHGHLGQLMTYAAGFNAGIVIWVATDIREEHRQALDWLNQRTDSELQFYGVVVEVLQIDESKPSFNFRAVAFPNEWRKARVSAANTAKVSERSEAYRVFFQELIDELRQRHQFTNARTGLPQNWYSFASGFTGISYGVSFAQRRRVRTEPWIDRGDVELNKALFDSLITHRAAHETVFGEALVWERLGERRGCRVASYRAGGIDDDPATLADVRSWAIDRLLRFRKTFSGPLADAVKHVAVDPA